MKYKFKEGDGVTHLTATVEEREEITKLLKKKGYPLYSDYKKGNIDVKVLLLSSEQNAEGINLNMFDKLIIFEPFEDHMYCKEIEKQLIGRIHRIGRIKPVDVFRLITENTIEQEIYYK